MIRVAELSRPGHLEPNFSVVIPTHDRPGYLSEAVESVLAQRRASLECLVVDDGSHLPLPRWDDPRVRVLRHEVARGPGAARNAGMRAARGRYIAFLDDDDLYAPTRLSTVEQYLSPTTAVVCWSQSIGASSASGRLLFGDESHRILDGPTPQIGTVTLPREVCPRFDERLRLNQDVEWWLRMAHAIRLFTVPYALHRFREHGNPRVTDQAEARVCYSKMLMEKHREYFAAHPRARAFRLRRMALISLANQDTRAALPFFVRSFRAAPSAKAAAHVLRAVAMGVWTLNLPWRVGRPRDRRTM